jgi:hypothetical protein
MTKRVKPKTGCDGGNVKCDGLEIFSLTVRNEGMEEDSDEYTDEEEYEEEYDAEEIVVRKPFHFHFLRNRESLQKIENYSIPSMPARAETWLILSLRNSPPMKIECRSQMNQRNLDHPLSHQK